MRSLFVSLAFMGMAAPGVAVAQTPAVLAETAAPLLRDCDGVVGFSFLGDNTPQVTCQADDRSNAPVQLTQNTAFGFSGSDAIRSPWYAIFAYQLGEGLCGVRFSETTEPGALPRATGYTIWSTQQIGRRGQPRSATLADIQLQAPRCVSSLIRYYDRAMDQQPHAQ